MKVIEGFNEFSRKSPFLRHTVSVMVNHLFHTDYTCSYVFRPLALRRTARQFSASSAVFLSASSFSRCS